MQGEREKLQAKLDAALDDHGIIYWAAQAKKLSAQLAKLGSHHRRRLPARTHREVVTAEDASVFWGLLPLSA